MRGSKIASVSTTVLGTGDHLQVLTLYNAGLAHFHNC